MGRIPARPASTISGIGIEDGPAVLLALAPRDLRYLGLIGSRAKVARIYDQLAADQMPTDFLQHVHAPIGLDIGAVTPQELAAFIAMLKRLDPVTEVRELRCRHARMKHEDENEHAHIES